jgi:PKD repeat protein
LLGIAFYNDLIGQACGDNGMLLRTTDGGNTWQTQNVTTDIWHQVIYVNQDTLYVVGTPEIIYKSTNGGVSWSNDYQQSTYNNAFYDVVITSNGTTWVCGSQGVLMRKYQLIQANFTASPTNACKGDSIQFTSTSTGNNLTYSWHFEGGSPPASAAKNPRVLYDSTGSFGAKLTISDGALSDSLYKPGYIMVTQTQAPVIILNVNTLASNIPTGNQWYRDGNIIQGATLQTYDIIQTGWYWDIVTQNGCSSDTSNNIYKLFVGMEDLNTSLFMIYPSPGDGKFTVSYITLKSSSSFLRVFNLMGVKVYEHIFQSIPGQQTEAVDLGNIPSGLYTVSITTNEGIITGKVVVNK